MSSCRPGSLRPEDVNRPPAQALEPGGPDPVVMLYQPMQGRPIDPGNRRDPAERPAVPRLDHDDQTGDPFAL